MLLERLEIMNEMATAGEFSSSGKDYIVLVRTRERNRDVPHFHVHVRGKSFSKDITIRLDRPEYFIHGNHKDTLNAKDKKSLIRFLEQRRRGVNNWDYLALSWEKSFPETKVPLDVMPDYSLLPDKKS